MKRLAPLLLLLFCAAVAFADTAPSLGIQTLFKTAPKPTEIGPMPRIVGMQGSTLIQLPLSSAKPALATNSTAGIVKIGSGITVTTDGTISAQQGQSGTITIGTTTTGTAGSNATVTNSGTSTNAVLNFTIPRGPQGIQGIQGVQGAQGAAGGSTNWRGEYAPYTQYSNNDAVSYQGASYIALTDVDGIAPPDPLYWNLLAAKGSAPVKGVDYFDGAKGDDGYTPVKGVDYFDGAKGDKGDKGDTGAAGGTVAFKGAWSSVVNYVALDVVSYNGSSYVAKGPSLNVSPTVTTSWQLMAQKGTDGAQGAQGQQGIQGVPGADGPNTVTSSTTTTYTGILKGNGSIVQQATAGTDYVAPSDLAAKADTSYVDTGLALKAPTASPTFTGTVTTGALTVGGNLSATSAVLETRTGTTTASTDGYAAAAGTIATSGTPVRISPRLRFTGYAWDTTAATSKSSNWIMENLPTSGTAVASKLNISHDLNGGGYANLFSLASNGDLTLAGNFIGGGSQLTGITPAQIGAATAAQGAKADNAVSKSVIVSVTDYGAVATTDSTCWTGPDSTAAFESAQTALGVNGGTVVVPQGQYCLSQLKIHDKVKIVGAGMVATVLVPIPTTNNDFVVFNNNNVTFFGLYDLQLDGHYYDHTSGNGIMLARTNDGSNTSPDKHGIIQRVRVQNFVGDGIKVTGACGAYNVIDVEYASNRVEYNRGAGFNLACTSDNFIHDNVSNSNQLEGFYVGSGAWANHYHNNKAFMNNMSASSTTAQWVFQGSVNNVLVDDEAQDSYQGGFIFNSVSFMDITGIQVSGALPAGKLGVSVVSSSDLAMSGFTNVAAGSTLGNAVKINGCTSCSVNMDGAASDYTLTGTNTGTSFSWKNHMIAGQTAEAPSGKFYKDDGTWGTPVASITCGTGKHVSALDASTGTATCTDDTGTTTGANDPNAVHVATAGEINAITAKTMPVTSDILLVEDSAASWAKKKVAIGDLGIVQGPASATNTGVARYSGTTGKLLKDSPLILDDTGNLYMPSGQKLMKNSATDAAGITIDRSDPNLATSNNYSLLDLTHTFSNGIPNGGTNVYGINETVSYGGTSTMGTVRGMMLSPRNAGGGTTSYVIGFSTWPRNTSGTVNGAIMGVEVQSPTNAGTITSGAYISGLYVGNQGLTGPGNTYGIKVADQSGGTNPYSLYTGTGKVFFGDDVQVKTLTSTIPAATTYASTTTIDLSLGDSPSVTLTGNPTLAFSNPKAGQWHRLNVIQGASGGPYTVTWPSTGLVCTWRNTSGHTAPTLLTAAGAVDTIVMHTLSTTSAECWTTGNL